MQGGEGRGGEGRGGEGRGGEGRGGRGGEGRGGEAERRGEKIFLLYKEEYSRQHAVGELISCL